MARGRGTYDVIVWETYIQLEMLLLTETRIQLESITLGLTPCSFV